MPNLGTVAPVELAQHVRESTLEAHRSTEGRPFIVALMRGELSIDDYARYLGQFAHVYEALEDRPVAGPPELLDPRLHRLKAIEGDLRAFGISDWRAEHPAQPATAAYVKYLRGIAPIETQRYLAHHYTRYLGDLSGGQAIARLVARHYGATPEQLRFYAFDEIDEIVPFKRAYRAGLNALGLDREGIDAFVDEVNSAFAFNGAIFDELDR